MSSCGNSTRVLVYLRVVCVCVHVCVCVCVYTHLCLCLDACLHVCLILCGCSSIFTYERVHLSAAVLALCDPMTQTLLHANQTCIAIGSNIQIFENSTHMQQLTWKDSIVHACTLSCAKLPSGSIPALKNAIPVSSSAIQHRRVLFSRSRHVQVCHHHPSTY